MDIYYYYIESFDDEMSCTFPPPDFDCPEGTMDISYSGYVYVDVEVCSEYCRDLSSSEYRLFVELDGVPAQLISLAEVPIYY